MQSDMVERVAMVDRARHLEVFEQLRVLQAQQREQLIRDQQNQWSRLQEGQRATEARLLAQRQNQWGSKTSLLILLLLYNVLFKSTLNYSVPSSLL